MFVMKISAMTKLIYSGAIATSLFVLTGCGRATENSVAPDNAPVVSPRANLDSQLKEVLNDTALPTGQWAKKIMLLISQGADVETRDHDGNTVLLALAGRSCLSRCGFSGDKNSFLEEMLNLHA